MTQIMKNVLLLIVNTSCGFKYQRETFLQIDHILILEILGNYTLDACIHYYINTIIQLNISRKCKIQYYLKE